MKTVDLRSDTVTSQDSDMIAAMCAAKVGDDVYGEDPAVIELEETVAKIVGQEAALFMPSGTMSNQVIAFYARKGRTAICMNREQVPP